MDEEKKEELEKPEESKEIDLKNLSTEFRDGIENERKGSNVFGIIIAAVLIIIIFGSMGVAVYQIFYKPEKLQTKTSDEKIESRPDESDVVTTTTTTIITATTTTTTKASSLGKQYTVVEGDTLGAIAAKYGTTVSALMSYNGIKDETSLQIGQVIKIP